jgi:hypothetical protein
MDFRSYNEAAKHFSTMLLLDPVDRMDVLIKRSKARASLNSWEEALSDADEVYIVLHNVVNSINNRARRPSSSTHHVIEATR